VPGAVAPGGVAPGAAVSATAAVAPPMAPAAAVARVAAEHAGSERVLCANCGAPVTSRYCSECGQRVEHAIHSVRHFILEVAEDLTHADSRLWRTMAALLFKPGFLTAEFLAGRRVRYLPPLRLYLVLSVLFFLISGLLHEHPSAWVFTMRDDGLKIEPAPRAVARPGESREHLAKRVCADVDYDGPWSAYVAPALRASCEKSVVDGGRGLAEAFTHNLPKAIFLAAPLLALVMRPLYRRPRRFYVEHVLFLLHDHAFLYLLFALNALAAAVLQIHLLVVTLGWGVALYIPYYYFVAMRRVYGQSRVRTLGKLAVLSLAYLVTAFAALVVTSLYSVLAL